MDSESKATTIIVVSVLILSTIAALGGCHEVEKTNRAAIEKGLVQKTLPGSSTAAWSTP